MKTFLITYKYITDEEFTINVEALNAEAAKAKFQFLHPFANIISCS